MTPFEFACFVDGWNEANGGEEGPEPMTADRLRELAPAATMH